MEAHTEVLPEETKRLLPSLIKTPFISQFYLAGGTGLALQLGHRISGDLDFFSREEFSESLLVQKLSELGELRLEKKAEQTVLAVVNGVKLSFLGYPYPLLFPLEKTLGLCVADLRDIACMKIDAVSSRGTKRDFIDLYYIIKTSVPLADLLPLFAKKYASLHYNLVHIKKSLVYFDDAEGDPLPQMLKQVEWNEVKLFFEREVVKVVQ
ncbi:MAG: nucleotidyl transferase AbiEii/AbiGii toxin family protein [Candidatus Liptonbacteria bacterium]|nr:nucleotidyl transferase AbiEii/AbiGii toxin family protein [Candidatus Liptonbacteria bacterium]